jgi:hypothetical protein
VQAGNQKRSKQERQSDHEKQSSKRNQDTTHRPGYLLERSVRFLPTAAEWTLHFSDFNADAFHPFLVVIIRLFSVYNRFVIFPVLDHEQKLARVVALNHEIIVGVVAPKRIAVAGIIDDYRRQSAVVSVPVHQLSSREHGGTLHQSKSLTILSHSASRDSRQTVLPARLYQYAALP